jgi:type II restriction enzyme
VSQSELLRKTHTELGGGKGIFTEQAKKLESNLSSQIQDLICVLNILYPNVGFKWKQKLSKYEISKEPNYKPHSEKSGVKPDGGILYAVIDGIEYPILVCEAKKQGTNDVRLGEGKTKQAKGNAIERAFKNFEEFRIYFEDYSYFPYVIFASGCDFEEGSSINDRLDAMTRYKPRNVDYLFDTKQLATIYIQEKPFTTEEIFDRIEGVSVKIINHILNDKTNR